MTDSRGLDDLSDVLERLRWSVGAYRQDTLKRGDRHPVNGSTGRFYFVADGAVDVRGDAESVALQAGAFLLAPRGGRHTFVAREETTLHSGELTVASAGAAPVLSALPDKVIAHCFVCREPIVAALIEKMAGEASQNRPGARSVVSQLGNVLAAAAIRSWVESGCGSADLLSVPLKDSDVGRALAAIHADPGEPWTLDRLARIGLASRSAFAERFRLAVGETPARYVARVRMEQAKRLLAERTTVAEVAVRLGYGSEAAFSRAFRRHEGVPPTTWRHAPTSGVVKPFGR